MPKSILVLLAFLLSIPIIRAQRLLSGRISDESGKPLAGATVSLIAVRDSSWLRSEISGNDGYYSLTFEQGTYLLQASAEGRQTQYQNITLDSTKTITHDFILFSSAKDLNGVTVNGKRQLIEVKPGMMVINVEGSAASAGSNALELLRRSPGVQVSPDGDISMRGKNGVLVYIDGRPSRLSGDALTVYLKSLTAEEIAQLELITQPSAKYEAAGTAGIINIRTRSIRKRGLNGSLSGTLTRATEWQGNLSARITYRSGRWTIYASEYFNYVDSYHTLRVSRNYRDAATGTASGNVLTEQEVRFNSRFHRLKAGAEYALSSQTTIGLRAQWPIGNPRVDYSNFTTITDLPTNSRSYTLGSRSMNNHWQEREIGLLGRHRFGQDRELSFDGFYVANLIPGDEGFFINTSADAAHTPTGAPDIWFLKFPVSIRLLSMSTDYTQPLGKRARLEAGAKYVHLSIDNKADYKIPDGAGHLVPDTQRSTRFIYHESLPAVYGSISYTFSKKLEAQAGLRAEQTVNDGLVTLTGETFSRSYLSLFPTFFASYKKDSLNTFTASYGRRLDRPQYHMLNPARDYIDKYSYRVGNPSLQPQFVHNLELAHFWKGQLTTTISGTLADGMISDYFVQDDKTKTAYEVHGNIAGYQQAGISTNYNKVISKWWTTNVYGDFYYTQYRGAYFGIEYLESGTQWSINCSNQLSLGRKWSADLSGWVNGPALTGVFTRSTASGSLDLAVAKKLMNDSLTIRLAVNDVLGTQRYRGYNVFANFDTDVWSTWDARRAVVSVAYNFGKNIETMQRKEGVGRGM